MADRRVIFPVAMFALAGVCFGYGTWQYVYAQRVQAAADARVAHIMEQVDGLAVAKKSKLDLYTAIFKEYPKGPASVGLDLSGIFAAPSDGDGCASDGQRAVCRALVASDESVRVSVCGACKPVAR
jgi:hypothetical protein